MIDKTTHPILVRYHTNAYSLTRTTSTLCIEVSVTLMKVSKTAYVHTVLFVRICVCTNGTVCTVRIRVHVYVHVQKYSYAYVYTLYTHVYNYTCVYTCIYMCVYM